MNAQPEGNAAGREGEEQAPAPELAYYAFVRVSGPITHGAVTLSSDLTPARPVRGKVIYAGLYDLRAIFVSLCLCPNDMIRYLVGNPLAPAAAAAAPVAHPPAPPRTSHSTYRACHSPTPPAHPPTPHLKGAGWSGIFSFFALLLHGLAALPPAGSFYLFPPPGGAAEAGGNLMVLAPQEEAKEEDAAVAEREEEKEVEAPVVETGDVLPPAHEGSCRRCVTHPHSHAPTHPPTATKRRTLGPSPPPLLPHCPGGHSCPRLHSRVCSRRVPRVVRQEGAADARSTVARGDGVRRFVLREVRQPPSHPPTHPPTHPPHRPTTNQPTPITSPYPNYVSMEHQSPLGLLSGLRYGWEEGSKGVISKLRLISWEEEERGWGDEEEERGWDNDVFLPSWFWTRVREDKVRMPHPPPPWTHHTHLLTPPTLQDIYLHVYITRPLSPGQRKGGMEDKGYDGLPPLYGAVSLLSQHPTKVCMANATTKAARGLFVADTQGKSHAVPLPSFPATYLISHPDDPPPSPPPQALHWQSSVAVRLLTDFNHYPTGPYKQGTKTNIVRGWVGGWVGNCFMQRASRGETLTHPPIHPLTNPLSAASTSPKSISSTARRLVIPSTTNQLPPCP